jgi:uncharacterized membrane protein YqaE (UPF0057 family)
MYLLAILCPPLAILLCGKPFQAVLGFVLWCCFWVPGSIYAVMVVGEVKADKRAERMGRMISAASAASVMSTRQKPR